jgi:cysteine desulfurase
VTRALYLDHNASTPPFDEVVEAMLPWLREAHANPHAEHVPGRRAAAAVESAKASIAALIGADGDDMVLTSGATEANNLVMQGVLRRSGLRTALVHSTLDHKSVAALAHVLAEEGHEVHAVDVDAQGRIAPSKLRSTLGSCAADQVLVSLIHASNEIGTIQDIDALALPVAQVEGLLHLDAVQSAAWVPIDVTSGAIDFVTMSAHKLGGPMGIGACYIAADLRDGLRPMMFGGGQQGGLRPGTVPVFLVVGFGVACDLALQRRDRDAQRAEAAASAFVDGLVQHGVRLEVLGDPVARLPGLRSVRFHGVEADDLLGRAGATLAASTGSACAAGELRASDVLRAIGLSEDEANQVVRFGFGRGMPIARVHEAVEVVASAYRACQS